MPTLLSLGPGFGPSSGKGLAQQNLPTAIGIFWEGKIHWKSHESCLLIYFLAYFGGKFYVDISWKLPTENAVFHPCSPQSGQQQWKKKKICPSPSRPAAALISFQCGASYFGSLPDRPVLCFWRILVYHLFLQLGASGTGFCLWICGDTKPPKTFRRYSWCSPFRIYPSKRPSASGVHGCLDSELQVLLALELRRNQSNLFLTWQTPFDVRFSPSKARFQRVF